MKIPVDLLQEKAPQNISKAIIEKFDSGTKTPAKANPVIRRKEMLESVALEDPAVAFERYMGDNNLLPINYLQLGYLRSRAIGRLTYLDVTEGRPAVATGFLISPDLVMTNHHVFGQINSFQNPLIEFDYEYDLNGREKTKVVFELSTQKCFYANKDLDMAIIGVSNLDLTGKHSINTRGYLVLNPDYGKADVGDFASIIQHPNGETLQIGLRENEIDNIDDPVFLKYQTDTARGSSGSPVFNDQWQVLALHSAGVAKRNAQGDYVDKDNQPIPIINGKVDAERIVWETNRGVRVSAMMTGLRNDQSISNHPLVAQLFTATYTDEKPLAFLSLPETENESRPGTARVTVSTLPLPIAQPVYFNIILGGAQQPFISGLPLNGIAGTMIGTSALDLEKKIEDEMDYSDCKGFDEYFMTDHTPMPVPGTRLKRKIAFLLSNPDAYVLKYHHYSTIHHAIRCMPVVSAINIYGKRRYAALEGRNDKWFRDRRIDFDVQLTDDFYAYSGMDRGHMARREDAEWGSNIAFAERAANMTCCYTNACPQVPELNRAKYGYYGEWGRIESEILEKGVVKEQGQESRICVYNGPIFDEDDRHFKGIQIPLQFFKIVVWRNADLEMKATAFKLSQEKLVSDIEWEELRFDEVFVHRQCSIEEIERLTDLSFPKVKDWDTFEAADPGEHERLIDAASLENLILDNASSNSVRRHPHVE